MTGDPGQNHAARRAWERYFWEHRRTLSYNTTYRWSPARLSHFIPKVIALIESFSDHAVHFDQLLGVVA